MERSARDGYLAAAVMTAPPQKLQLMLIEAAICAAARASQHWNEGRGHDAAESLLRAQAIVGHILASLDRETEPELAGRTAAVYLFIFRRLLDANVGQDRQKLGDAIRVLEAERETWRLVCENLAASPNAPSPPFPAAAAPVPLPPIGLPIDADSFDALPAGSFSLEA